MSEESHLGTVRAELASVARMLDENRRRVAGLADSVPADREGLVSAIYEAERALQAAQRLVARAEKLAE
jgi:hypothetical protein